MLGDYVLSHAVAFVTAVASLFVAIRLLSSRRTPQSLLAWLLAVAFLPIVAIPLYLAFGSRKLPPKTPPAFKRGEGDVPVGDVERVLVADGAPPARDGHAFELIDDGVAAFEKLIALLDGAKASIDLTMFIIGDDATGRALVATLAARARAGVDVRLLIDAVGSARIAGHATRTLTQAGGSVRRFMPLLHVPFRGRTNLRSHRKLAIVDGARVFLGGMNAALEYMGAAKLDTRWRDVAAIVSGPVAVDATALFESDWVFAGGEPAKREGLAADAAAAPRGEARVQLVPSGPDMPSDTFYDGLLTAIYGARERLSIVTPYYVPDETVEHAIVLAARRGVRVEIVLPARSNHPLADFARRPLVRELAAAGATLRWHPKMVHAKAVAVDDSFAYVGSPNLDMRSFFLNYEDALVLCSAPEVGEIHAYAARLAAECDAPEPRAGREKWLLEQIARLVAPEL